jgi:hypothetical protein
MQYRRILVAITAAMVLLAFASNASAFTLHPIIPGGVSSTNDAAAITVIKQRAAIDPGLGISIAQNAHATSYVASDYVADGYQMGALGSSNAGISDSGAVVATADTAECNIHSLVVRMKNVKTNVDVLFCVKCGNIRLHPVQPPKPHPFAKTTVIKFKQKVTRSFKGLCPGTDKTFVTVVDTGKIVASTWGQAIRLMHLHLNVTFKHKIKESIKQICSKPLPPKTCQETNTCPPPPAQTFTSTLSISIAVSGAAAASAGLTVTCPDGTVVAAGSASASAVAVAISLTDTETSTISQQDAANKVQTQLTQWTLNLAAAVAASAASVTTVACPPPTGGGGETPASLTLSNLTAPQNGPGGVMPDGEVISLCVTATSNKPGHNIKLHFAAVLGHFVDDGMVPLFASTGIDTRCATYVAPNDAGDVGQTETISVNGVDVTAGIFGTPNPLRGQFVFQPLPGGDH